MSSTSLEFRRLDWQRSRGAAATATVAENQGSEQQTTMRSMTGFGIGETPIGNGRLIIELRSLNHRYTEVRVRMPSELSDQAFLVEQLARGALGRGRFDVSVRLEGSVLPSPELSVERARAVYQALAQLRDEVAPGSPLSVEAVTRVPGVFDSPTLGADAGFREALERAFRQAATRLADMRSREGQALAVDLASRLSAVRQLRTQLEARRGDIVDLQRERLRERLLRLLNDTAVSVDAGRMEVELALLADKSDITEELVRLDSHFSQFGTLLQQPTSVGRRLDFLLQEVAREVNTIGAKCQDAAASHLVVEMKAEVERMREQVQNVE